MLTLAERALSLGLGRDMLTKLQLLAMANKYRKAGDAVMVTYHNHLISK
jgi:hypothetical protein